MDVLQNKISLFDNGNGWVALSYATINGIIWRICTKKRYSGISTHCQNIEINKFYYLNKLPKGTYPSKEVIKKTHSKSLEMLPRFLQSIEQ